MEQAMTKVIVARAATLLIKYTLIGVTSITLVLLQFSGELFAHSRPAISNWTGLL